MDEDWGYSRYTQTMPNMKDEALLRQSTNNNTGH